MPVLLIQLPYGDPFLGQLPEEARDTIREDLTQYEKDYGIRLEIDPNTGDYEALSQRASHVLPELYTNNPNARRRLVLKRPSKGGGQATAR